MTSASIDTAAAPEAHAVAHAGRSPMRNAITSRRGLLKAVGALGATASVGPMKVAIAADAGPQSGCLSPAFEALRRERAELCATSARLEAALLEAGPGLTPAYVALEPIADAALELVWASNERLMTMPAVLPADLGLKAEFLIQQPDGAIEEHHVKAIAADLLRLFPLHESGEVELATAAHGVEQHMGGPYNTNRAPAPAQAEDARA